MSRRADIKISVGEKRTAEQNKKRTAEIGERRERNKDLGVAGPKPKYGWGSLSLRARHDFNEILKDSIAEMTQDALVIGQSLKGGISYEEPEKKEMTVAQYVEMRSKKREFKDRKGPAKYANVAEVVADKNLQKTRLGVFAASEVPANLATMLEEVGAVQDILNLDAYVSKDGDQLYLDEIAKNHLGLTQFSKAWLKDKLKNSSPVERALVMDIFKLMQSKMIPVRIFKRMKKMTSSSWMRKGFNSIINMVKNSKGKALTKADFQRSLGEGMVKQSARTIKLQLEPANKIGLKWAKSKGDHDEIMKNFRYAFSYPYSN